MEFEIPTGLQKVVKDVKNKGGKSCLVGGAVIDILQDRELKDWDVEVYGLNMPELENVLKNYGTPNLVGKSFGVIKMNIDGQEYDFSVPRLENNVGLGHKDFNVELVPDLSPAQAAYRRDLTINSMFFGLDDKTLVDPYDGKKDLENGILRHTGEQFSEDPLRVLRIMQLLPRKGKTVAPETIELCKSMKDQHQYLPKERIFGEWNKMLMKSKNPSMGLNFLFDCEWIDHYPEIAALKDIEQNLEWHPEGNVKNHTFQVVDYAASLRENLREEWKMPYMFGALLHDVGKAVTTSTGLTSHGHDMAGVSIAEEFMERITNEKGLTNKTLSFVQNHMAPGSLYRAGSGKSAWKRLHNRIPLDAIAYMSKADGAGKGSGSLDDYHAPSVLALKYSEEFGEGKIPAVLMGRDLIQEGYTPGRDFSGMLKYAYNLQIDEGISSKTDLVEKVREKYDCQK